MAATPCQATWDMPPLWKKPSLVVYPSFIKSGIRYEIRDCILFGSTIKGSPRQIGRITKLWEEESAFWKEKSKKMALIKRFYDLEISEASSSRYYESNTM
jgi:hypothetical protein